MIYQLNKNIIKPDQWPWGYPDAKQGWLLFENFEEGNIFSAGNATPSRISGAAKSGSYGLSLGGEGKFVQAVTTSIIAPPSSVEYAAIFETWVQLKVSPALAGICFGVPESLGQNGYQCFFDDRNGLNGISTMSCMQIRKDYNTASLLASATPFNAALNTWYKIRVEWTSDGGITFTAYNSSGSELGSISASNQTAYTQGRIGVSTHGSAYFDDFSYMVE